MRGNVMDMAVGIIIGLAFGKVVTSQVNDIVLPPVRKLLGNVDFSNFFITLAGQHYVTLADAKKAGAVTIAYGTFLNTIIEFLIVAFAVFVLIKWVNRLMPRPDAGVDAKTRMDRLGHVNDRVNMIYSHTGDKAQRAASQLVFQKLKSAAAPFPTHKSAVSLKVAGKVAQGSRMENNCEVSN